MRLRARRPIVGGVSTNAPDHFHRIEIELRFDGAAPAGTVRLAGGEARDFSGWIGLVCSIEAVADTSRETPGGG